MKNLLKSFIVVLCSTIVASAATYCNPNLEYVNSVKILSDKTIIIGLSNVGEFPLNKEYVGSEKYQKIYEMAMLAFSKRVRIRLWADNNNTNNDNDAGLVGIYDYTDGVSRFQIFY